MDCREAQALIVPFIEGNLTDEQAGQFFAHIENCSECYDELEVYYIVMVGAKQLDEDEHMIVNFGDDLRAAIFNRKEQIERKQHRAARRRFGVLIFSLILLFAAGFIYYNIDSHPDVFARYLKSVSQALDLDMDFRPGERQAFIFKEAEAYFPENKFALPLRRIQINEEKEGMGNE